MNRLNIRLGRNSKYQVVRGDNDDLMLFCPNSVVYSLCPIEDMIGSYYAFSADCEFFEWRDKKVIITIFGDIIEMSF